MNKKIVYGIGYKNDNGEYEVEEGSFSTFRSYIERLIDDMKREHPYPEKFKLLEFKLNEDVW